MPEAAKNPSSPESTSSLERAHGNGSNVTGASDSGLAGFRRIGIAAWSAIGIIVLALLIAGGISALSGILVPLVIAVILGTVLEPIVAWLVRHRMSRALAATVVLLLALVLVAGISIAVVNGLIQQTPEIMQQMLHGWSQLMEWLRMRDLDPSWMEQLRAAADSLILKLEQGAVGAVTGAVYNTVMLSLGVFFALYFLFFVLRDGMLFPKWLARVTSQDESLVTRIDAQVRESIRGYFSGTAITALITGPIFILPLLLLGIPLIIPMIVLYFLLSFVPYFGAWITGAFAVLIAFGFGGAQAALIVGLALLVSNGPIQNVVLSWALGTSLSIHPVMVLLSTIIGGVVAGILGMVLGPPVVSALQKAITTVREYRAGASTEFKTPDEDLGMRATPISS